MSLPHLYHQCKRKLLAPIVMIQNDLVCPVVSLYMYTASDLDELANLKLWLPCYPHGSKGCVNMANKCSSVYPVGW